MKHLVPLLAALAAAGTVHATELNFDTYNGATYGDRVTGPGLGYGSAGGATPNITMEWVPDSGRPFSVYNGGYASLLNALGHNNYNEPGFFRFTPDEGWDVVLHGFDIAAWAASAYPDSRIRVVDGAGVTRYDSGLFTFAPRTVLQPLAAPIRSHGPLTVYVQDFGDLGIDNVVFSQVSSVPEAPPAALLAAGLGLLALVRTGRAGKSARRWPARGR